MADPQATRRSSTGAEAPEAPPEQIRRVIPSTFDAGREVQEEILAAAARHGFGEETGFGLKLALEEGLINAIKHGNKLAADKQVTVEADFRPNAVRIGIEDQGPGFDRNKVPDPTLEENLEKCSGRGILLMEAYMDEVNWDREGRRVTLIKRKT
ncbi:MAG: ATP-binding protein [Phycisphaerae bacterium]